MVLRKFNYTGRKRIMEADCRFDLIPRADGDYSLRALLDLSGYGFPDKARVVVEAYGRGYVERFLFGTVDAIEHKGEAVVGRTLDPNGKPKLKVKVLSVDDDAKLLGLLRRVTPGEPNVTETSLIGVVRSDELGQLVWDVVHPDSSDSRPWIRVNSALDGGDSIAFSRRPEVGSVIFPSVVREVLWRLLRVHNHRDHASDDWWGHWLRFAEELTSSDVPAGGDDHNDYLEDSEWIDEAAMQFAVRMNARNLYEGWQEALE